MGLASVSIAGANSPLTVNLPDGNTAVQQDDTAPDVTARVARISYLSGDIRSRRLQSEEWEKATLNLPIVEGDEITSAGDSRFEVQFDRSTHLRVSDNSYIKISRLNYDGVALSLPQGLASLRVRDFDKDKSYFEIDAPGTTVAVQREGMYRIDAGQPGDNQIKLAVTKGGEARIYSETSGFLLKNGGAQKSILPAIPSANGKPVMPPDTPTTLTLGQWIAIPLLKGHSQMPITTRTTIGTFTRPRTWTAAESGSTQTNTVTSGGRIDRQAVIPTGRRTVIANGVG
ncbi:MAG: FecR domain-containing protein [Chloracidobacterium sp.]|nr:FecR domain-containing protein [Chloracidobacterium sp.]